MNSYKILNIFSGFKALPLLAIPEQLGSVDGFLKNVQPIYIFYLTFCSLMEQDLHETALPTDIMGNWLIGLYVLPCRLTGVVYYIW
jgi:hypothetical protein